MKTPTLSIRPAFYPATAPKWPALLAAAALFLLPSRLSADVFDPALAALKARYQSEVQGVSKARDAAAEASRQPYAKALDAVEAKVTAAGNTASLKAVLEEKRAVESGSTLSPVQPAALPREILPLRTAYLREHARTGQATALRLQQLQSGYLRELGTFETRARASQNKALLEQTAIEKLALADEKPITIATSAVPKGKNAALNGDFSQTGTDGRPLGWGGTSSGTSIQTENANSYLRYTTDTPSGWNPIARQQIAIPPSARKCELSVKMRAKDLKMAPSPGDNSGINILAEICGPTGSIIQRIAVSLRHQEKNWLRRESSAALAKGAFSMNLIILFGSATGTVDVDELVVELK